SPQAASALSAATCSLAATSVVLVTGRVARNGVSANGLRRPPPCPPGPHASDNPSGISSRSPSAFTATDTSGRRPGKGGTSPPSTSTRSAFSNHGTSGTKSTSNTPTNRGYGQPLQRHSHQSRARAGEANGRRRPGSLSPAACSSAHSPGQFG